MTYQEATELKLQNLHLIGREYFDKKKNQNERILQIVVTPQDHPFFPEFLSLYVRHGSYEDASRLMYEKHRNEILYSAKCVMDDIYEIRNEVPLNVFINVQVVLQLI